MPRAGRRCRQAAGTRRPLPDQLCSLWLAVDRLTIAHLTWPAPLARRFPAGLLAVSDTVDGGIGWAPRTTRNDAGTALKPSTTSTAPSILKCTERV
jgi:hypothetical protein